jgi:entericidin B
MIKRLVSALLTVMLVAVLSGCHTIHGMGQDIEQGGKAIEKAAH